MCVADYVAPHSVVFVHGLQGHPKSTWTSNSRQPKASAEPKPTLVDRVKGFFRSSSPAAATTDGTVAHVQPVDQLSSEEGSTGDTTVEEEVHSLDQGNAQEGPPPKVVFWPEDLLAKDFPDLRVLTYGYDSQVWKFFGTVPHHNLYTLGRSLSTSVANSRTLCVSRKACLGLCTCHV